MSRRNLLLATPLAVLIAAACPSRDASAQTPPGPAGVPAPSVEPSRGPDSKDLFESIHVIVGPSARALDPIAVSPFP